MKNMKISALALVLSLSSAAALASDATSQILERFTHYPFAVMTASHRAQAGLESRIFPENSLAAMELAINRGVSIIECDPRLTADGEYVLMHDSTLDRTTNVAEVFPDRAEKEGKYKGKYLVNKFTLAEIKQLKLTDGFDGQEHRVPTLREALTLAKDRVFLDLDLKEIDIPQLEKLIAEFGKDNLLAYNSNAEKLKEVTDKIGVIPLPINTPLQKGGDPVADFKKFKEMWGDEFKIMHTQMADISPELLDIADKSKVRLWINTLNDPDGAAERFDYSVWKSYLNSGANVFQSDLAIELTRFIELRDACTSLKNVKICDTYR
ncbi:glycerophosphodiester phosphodiesterase family protein [Pasteurellaceae bacterium 20609_3]|uniref:glycerophosphodiester phosphodiesterase family protein n=1 Tax=Spirabiliibacterium mucosae TaxID=28156 RepID=UPI001AAC61CB|nr:glycerophosphodiester phosphodiesterase family protein [Spirabiliibacterium mucosae]MBE2898732.1 glycerophosphodiester phosphodiesterase family protein [Spirabiliibacterium mucosae]